MSNGSATLPFVIPSVPGFPTSLLSVATTYVVLPKENHMQLIEVANLDRKSGVAEGPAVRHSALPNPSLQTSPPKQKCHPERTRISYFTALGGDHVCGSP